MRQSLVNITALDGEAVLPLDLAKAHLRVLDDDSDDLIAAFRDAAVDMVEQYAQRAMASRDFKWLGRFSQVMRFGIGPVTAITVISYLDTEGASQTPVVADTLRVAFGDQVEFKMDVDIPDIADGDGVVEITFTAGHDDNLPLPPSLVAAAKLMLGHLFMNREAVAAGTAMAEIPFGVKQLCAPYRPVRL